MMNPSDKKFITDAVNDFSDTVFRVAFQYVGIRDQAEDILQEVFLQLLKTPPDIAGNKELKSWLIRVTINKSIDYLRAEKRRRAELKSYEPPAKANSHDEVFEALFRLKERDRTAIYLHYYEGYTAKEIAAMTGDNERAVTKRIGRAREKLKNILEEQTP